MLYQLKRQGYDEHIANHLLLLESLDGNENQYIINSSIHVFVKCLCNDQ